MRCTKCNYDNPADALFCMKCGGRLENRCTSCETINQTDANFCRKCGSGGHEAGAHQKADEVSFRSAFHALSIWPLALAAAQLFFSAARAAVSPASAQPLSGCRLRSAK